MGRFFLTGDTHGNFNRIDYFCKRMETTKDDILCILGDAGINYFLGKKDYKLKQLLQDMPITLFCVHGNHEERPFNIPSYTTKEWNGGIVYYEKEFPNILFPQDGEIFTINGKECLVIGGAYSVDKDYRIAHGWNWFKDEQPTKAVKSYIEKIVTKHKKVNLVLTHTCPYDTMPRHMFLPFIDQSKVDNSTEEWLQNIANFITFDDWYFGHYHGRWNNGKYHMLFEDYVEIGSENNYEFR